MSTTLTNLPRRSPDIVLPVNQPIQRNAEPGWVLKQLLGMNANASFCPRCKGTGADPHESPKPGPSGIVSADRCCQCSGSGRL